MFSDYELFFPHNSKLIINTLNDGLITSQTKEILLDYNKLSVTKHLFENDALVCMNSQISEVHLISSKSKHGVELISENWPYYGIWSKKGCEQFVCLEPWYGIADNENTDGDFVSKNGIIKVEPEQYFNCSFNMMFF